MEKINPETPDLTQENIDKIAKLFPDVVTEMQDADGNVVRAIDFDALKGDLSGGVAEGKKERYQFTWPGKAAAKLEARTPCDKTMRPCPEESVNWDTTQNLYIEGDNLEALKIMRETYAGKVKLIYIDPPYNTGHDFIYDDDFSQSCDDYEEASDEFDEEGGRLVANPESNGRFHSDWCSMIYPRLMLARDMLSSDGAIFISIDDNEVTNLRKLCDEVFGVGQFVADVIWQHSVQSNGYGGKFVSQYNHLLVYSKTADFHVGNLPRSDEDNKLYTNPDNDPKGSWRAGYCVNGLYRANLKYEIHTPHGKVIAPPEKGWRWSKDTLQKKIDTGEILFNSDETRIIHKLYLSDLDGKVPENIWINGDAGTTRQATSELKELFDGMAPFDTPKPTKLLERVLTIASDQQSIVLDFFSGSATTAHAVMNLNAKDCTNRKFIMVQLPESCCRQNEVNRADYENICDIGKERIRRAGAKIVAKIDESNRQLKIDEAPKSVPDIGFRVLKISSSNYRSTYGEPEGFAQDSLEALIDNLKIDRTPEDLLFQVMPKLRIPYSAAIEKINLCGKRIFNVNNGQLLACFDESVNVDTIEAIAKRKPVYAVLRDASLVDDSTAANFEELFKTFSPDTIRRVI